MIWNIFSFKTKDDLRFYGGLIKGKKKTNKLVIHVHGMTDFFYDGSLVLALAKSANISGYDLMTFNNRGMGVVSRIGKIFLGTSLETFEDCILDIDAALAEAKKLGYTQIILSGHSTGCQKVTYYQGLNKNLHVKSIILLSPADDLNFHKKLLGKKFIPLLEEVKKMVEKHQGDSILPSYFQTAMFSAKRFYHLLKENSIEGNVFNYEKPLHAIAKLSIPVLAIFGSEEQYAAMEPKKMLEKIAEKFTNKKSKTTLVKGGDHSYHEKEKQLTQAVKNFLTAL